MHVNGGDGNQLSTLPAEQVFSVISSLIDRQIKNDQYRHELDRLIIEYAELSKAQDEQVLDRNADREAALRVVTLLISMGLADHATLVFNNFINRGPKFAQEVCDLIVKRYEMGKS